jgi:hypothetical protein
MDRRAFLTSVAALCALGTSSLVTRKGHAVASKNCKEYQVGVYYFPNWHNDPSSPRAPGELAGEWPGVQAARPRFPGHRQPLVPAWGYLDEADPKVMEKKIDAAADHGVDYWIFDWYWLDNGPFLRRCIEGGFLRARNNRRVKFCCMWANHDMGRGRGAVTPETFHAMTTWMIENLFKHPSHFLVEGRPYFSVFNLQRLIDSFGSLQGTRAALDDFRARIKAAGLPGLHLNVILNMTYRNPGDAAPTNTTRVLDILGCDSIADYHWLQQITMPEFPETEYRYVRDHYLDYWETVEKKYRVPYFPNVTVGWDSTPRTDASVEYRPRDYPYMAVLRNNTPEAFKEALEIVKRRLDQRRAPKILNIYAWNEWTEGGYLEPDTVHGMAYLEAIKAVFGANP